MSIIISQNGQPAQKIDKSDFEKEGYLQEYIHKNPESIPVYEIDEDKKLFVVAREFSTESGPIDVLAIDKDGDIYVVETKLQKNYTRREVVAQALDYGASLWRHSDYGEFINKINNEINNKFKISFEEKIKDFFNIDEEQIEIVLEAIRRNLQQGNIKFVILMDAIDDQLKDLIVYINQNSQFDIYAVQMEYYKFESYEIMIPKLFGVEVKKSMSSAGSRIIKSWTPDEFLIDAKKRLTSEQYKAVEKLFDFSKQNSDDIVLGKGQGKATINPIFSKISERKIYGLDSNGKLGFHIDWSLSGANSDESKSKLELMSKKLNKIGLAISAGEFRDKNEIEKWSDKVNEIVEILNEAIK
ncbi:MAG: hypothetical protein WC621_02500 [Patescibacteria group bacterium]